MSDVLEEGFRRCAVIVAHPDDETLWAGGTILMNPHIEWTIVTLCRQSDPDRSVRFRNALKALHATGDMRDLDDGPDQQPLSQEDVHRAILSMLPGEAFDLIITHSIDGEYTRHLRHEETGRAVEALWRSGKLPSPVLWSFAYEDGQRAYLPRAIVDADIHVDLPDDIWREKYRIITEVYGFSPDSFEARTTPRQEAYRPVE